MYRITFKNSASKELLSLPLSVQKAIDTALSGEFQLNPYTRSLDIRKLERPFSGYRIRVGNYRLLYTIQDRHVEFYKISHRKDAYK